MAAPTRITVGSAVGLAIALDGGMQPPAGEYVDAASFERLAAGLQAAHAGLASAANQFAAMRESQQAGHFPEVHNNPEKFAEKAEAAARALADLDLPTSPAPAAHDQAEVRRTPSGAGGDQASSAGTGTGAAFTGAFRPGGEIPPHQTPAGDTAAGAPSVVAGDGATPPRDAAPAGGRERP